MKDSGITYEEKKALEARLEEMVIQRDEHADRLYTVEQDRDKHASAAQKAKAQLARLKVETSRLAED
eukprot:COSAG05_NODE_15064_length_379_cov_0.903571_1_plen_66_part_10